MKSFHSYFNFEYVFVPKLMERYMQEGYKLRVLNDKFAWRGLLTRLFVDSGFDWWNLTIHTFGNEDDDTILVLYVFPKPFQAPLAKYGAIIYLSGKLRYYTLELSDVNTYKFCMITTYGAHILYELSSDLSLDMFLTKICALNEITLPPPQSVRSKESIRDFLRKII